MEENKNLHQESECNGCNYAGGKCPFTGRTICNLTGDIVMNDHERPCIAWFK
jgi:translation initiation factor RLI1